MNEQTHILYSEVLAAAAFDYGRNIGIAFQLVDDILDFEAREDNYTQFANLHIPLLSTLQKKIRLNEK